MKPIGLLIFDLDGTLVNTLEDIAASVNYTLGLLSKPLLDLPAVRRYVGDGLEKLLERALGSIERAPQAAAIYTEHHRKNLVVRSSLYPFVQETLEHFRTIPMAVVTNKRREFSIPLLGGLGLGSSFRMVIGAGDGLPLKPAPDALLAIMAACGVSKERTAIVGDSLADVLAGKAAGVTTCSVTYGFRAETELRQAGPDHIIHTFSELTTLFAPEI